MGVRNKPGRRRWLTVRKRGRPAPKARVDSDVEPTRHVLDEGDWESDSDGGSSDDDDFDAASEDIEDVDWGSADGELDMLLDAGAPFLAAPLMMRKCAAMLTLAGLRRRRVPGAVEAVAEMFGLSVSTVYACRNQALSNDGELMESCRGLHPKTRSAFNDDAVKTAIRAYIKENAVVLGRPNIRVRGVAKFVNELLPSLGYKKVAESTVLRWMHQLGFKLRRLKGKVWVDGHDRPDVLAQRREFLRVLRDEIWPRQPLYFLDNEKKVQHVDTLADITQRRDIASAGGIAPQPDKQIVVYWQDEVCFATHDFEKVAWLDDVRDALAYLTTIAGNTC